MQDYVYAFRPLAGVTVNASLCESSFDTKLILFKESSTSDAPTLVSCNDDGCGSQSWLQVSLVLKLGSPQAKSCNVLHRGAHCKVQHEGYSNVQLYSCCSDALSFSAGSVIFAFAMSAGLEEQSELIWLTLYLCHSSRHVQAMIRFQPQRHSDVAYSITDLASTFAPYSRPSSELLLLYAGNPDCRCDILLCGRWVQRRLWCVAVLSGSP